MTEMGIKFAQQSFTRNQVKKWLTDGEYTTKEIMDCLRAFDQERHENANSTSI